MELKERTLCKHYVFEGKLLRVRQDEAALPDGKRCVREVVEHPGAVCVLCVCEGKVALVRQFRYAVGEELLELPAGKLERGEAPESAALRELGEETGLCAKEVRPLFSFYPTPGYSDEAIHIYEAVGAERGESHPDEGEFLEAEFVPIEKAYTMIEDGRIKDGKTVAALLFYKHKNE